MIVDFTVNFDFINEDQALIIVDEMDATSKIGEMPVGTYSLNSTTSKLP